MALLKRLRGRFDRLSLGTKIMLVLLSIGAFLGGLQAIASLAYSTHLILSSVGELLEARVRRETRSLEVKLASLVAVGESLANNRLTANALADSAGRRIYLQPLLQSQKLPVAGASVALLDYRGRPLAGSDEAATQGWDRSDPDAAARRFENMIRNGGAQAALARLPQGGAALDVLLPVIYRLTGNIEGAVVVRVPLQAMAPPTEAGEHFALLDASGHLLSGEQAEDAIKAAAPLDLPPPLDSLGLTQVLTYERDVAIQRLDGLVVLYGVFALVYTTIVFLLARQGSRLLSAPVLHLTSVAERIATSGRPSEHLEQGGVDEFGRLARAFNTMIDRLRASYADLESQVEERTRALSEREARLRFVMDATGEGVWDWNISLGRVQHNSAWCELLGLGQDFLEHAVSEYLHAIHPEDLPAVKNALDACLAEDRPFNLEYRMRHQDGHEIWVHDRGKVVQRDAQGHPLRMVGSISDISARVAAGAALRERELYLRATLDNLPFLFWLKDANNHFLAVNKLFADTCGQPSPEAVVGRSNHDIWPADLADQYTADDLEVMQQRKEKAVEELVEGENGRRSWMEAFKKPVMLEDGTLLGTVGFARDITQRRQMEDALRQSEERWQLAITGANDGIWDWNPATGETFYSDRWKSMLGYAPQEIAPDVDEWLGRIHRDDRTRVVAELSRHLSGQSDYYQSEYRMRCRDGSYKWILDRGKALFSGVGLPQRMCGSHSDISERRNAEAQVQERTGQLDAILSLSPDGFVSFDAELRVRYASPAFLHLFAVEEERLLGLSQDEFDALMAELCDPAAPYPGTETLRSHLSQETASRQRQLLELRKPLERVVEVGLCAGRSAAVPQILYFRDVTLEQEVDRMKSEFLSTAAHELRTPMASIYGFTELMMNMEMDDSTRKDVLATIYGQAGLMVSIINELLDLARIEARQGKDFNREPQELGQLVATAISGFHVPAGRQPPVLEASPTPLPVRADRQKMQQALVNVLSNAYKYSPDGGDVVVRLRSQPAAAGGEEVGVEIEDHGIGMTPAQLARICERFYRADTSGKFPGTGLGMSIVREIISLHGGRMELDSRYGRGTRVSLWLPAS